MALLGTEAHALNGKFPAIGEVYRGKGQVTPRANPPSPTKLVNMSSNNSQAKDVGVNRVTVKGGQLWRQLQTDTEAARQYGLKIARIVDGGPVATVYKAEDSMNLVDGKPSMVALKVMNWSGVLGDYRRSIYPRVINTYLNIKEHPNIVRVLKYFVDGQSTFLVMEWCSLGSMSFALGPQGCLARGVTETLARDFLLQICAGLQFLMDNDLPHGRLTCDNILLNKGFKVKLNDYGYPPSTNSNSTDDDLHLCYRAPELLRGKPFTGFSGDIWSLGVVLYAMLHAGLPYTARDLMNCGQRSSSLPPLIFRASLTYPCKLMLKRLLTYMPIFRPSLSSVLTDPWLQIQPKGPDRHHPQCYRDQAPKPSSQHMLVPHSFDTTPDSCSRCQIVQKLERAESGEDSSGSRAAVAYSSPYGLAAITPPRTLLTLKWLESYSKQLCPECLQAKQVAPGEESSPVDPPWMAEKNGVKMCPRVAAMFTRFLPTPVDAITYPIKDIRKPKKAKESKPESKINIPRPQQVTDQLVDFLKYSERMRAKFVRFYGGNIPRRYNEFPLPPVVIMDANPKSNKF